jgi:ribosomal protein L34
MAIAALHPCHDRDHSSLDLRARSPLGTLSTRRPTRREVRARPREQPGGRLRHRESGEFGPDTVRWLAGSLAPIYAARLSRPESNPMVKLFVRRSKLKRKKKVGFRTRSKTAGGRKVIKRKRKRFKGKYRVG